MVTRVKEVIWIRSINDDNTHNLESQNPPYNILMSLLTWPEKEKKVVDLRKKEVSPKEIASQLHMSLRDV